MRLHALGGEEPRQNRVTESVPATLGTRAVHDHPHETGGRPLQVPAAILGIRSGGWSQPLEPLRQLLQPVAPLQQRRDHLGGRCYGPAYGVGGAAPVGDDATAAALVDRSVPSTGPPAVSGGQERRDLGGGAMPLFPPGIVSRHHRGDHRSDLGCLRFAPGEGDAVGIDGRPRQPGRSEPRSC